MPEQKKRFVICGLSARAIGLYIPALTQPGPMADRNQLAGILDLDRDRLDTWLRETGLDVPVYAPEQFSQMLDDLRPDGVIVTTPDGLHVDYVVDALTRDLDVIVEKPMVIDGEQARRIFTAEASSNGALQVTHNSRYEQGNLLIRDLIVQGKIGRITNVTLDWQIDTYHGSSYFWRWNRDRAKSGGMSITKGCHHFDLLNWWIGDVPEVVSAFGALNYYGPNSPHNPSVIDNTAYSTAEQIERCAYHQHWFHGATDDHVGLGKSLPNEAQYPSSQRLYIYDEEIAIEDTYSAIIRYRGGASVAYSANFSAPQEGYTLAINGTHGRIERTNLHDRAKGISSDPVLTYYPIFGDPQILDIPLTEGMHGGADPLLLHNLFVEPVPQDAPLGLRADSYQAALAVVIGEAIWRSVTEQRMIRIDELIPVNKLER